MTATVQPVLKLAVNAKNLLVFDGLYNPQTTGGGYVNNATLTCKLYESNGTTNIAAFTFTVTYITGSDGDYEGYTVKLDMIAAGKRYWVEITDASGFVYRWCEAVGYKRGAT